MRHKYKKNNFTLILNKQNKLKFLRFEEYNNNPQI